MSTLKTNDAAEQAKQAEAVRARAAAIDAEIDRAILQGGAKISQAQLEYIKASQRDGKLNVEQKQVILDSIKTSNPELFTNSAPRVNEAQAALDKYNAAHAKTQAAPVVAAAPVAAAPAAAKVEAPKAEVSCSPQAHIPEAKPAPFSMNKLSGTEQAYMDTAHKKTAATHVAHAQPKHGATHVAHAQVKHGAPAAEASVGNKVAAPHVVVQNKPTLSASEANPDFLDSVGRVLSGARDAVTGAAKEHPVLATGAAAVASVAALPPVAAAVATTAVGVSLALAHMGSASDKLAASVAKMEASPNHKVAMPAVAAKADEGRQLAATTADKAVADGQAHKQAVINRATMGVPAADVVIHQAARPVMN